MLANRSQFSNVSRDQHHVGCDQYTIAHETNLILAGNGSQAALQQVLCSFFPNGQELLLRLLLLLLHHTRGDSAMDTVDYYTMGGDEDGDEDEDEDEREEANTSLTSVVATDTSRNRGRITDFALGQ